MFIADPVWRFATVAPAMVRPLSLAGSMWPTVVTRKSDLYWRQTDDEHPSCVYVSRDVRRGLCYCRHYELCGYTDESSATRTFSNSARFGNGTETVVCVAVRARIFTGFVGLAVINPTLFRSRILRGFHCAPILRSGNCFVPGLPHVSFSKQFIFDLPPAGSLWFSCIQHGIPMRSQQPRRTRSTSSRVLPASRILVVCHRTNPRLKGSRRRGSKIGGEVRHRHFRTSEVGTQIPGTRQHAVHPI